ncbi:hypothetical protein PENANT_c164G08059 [Penicillium antarcticum]|uniref:Uncharacterized protein n=1 Tax=Penicillium antarcticum TaxID=416450 RepID=A0A1V6PDA4_9EURO|nr:hypothetical protein PENANT_c164G08059 [Penicillium antarcticum]
MAVVAPASEGSLQPRCGRIASSRGS